MIRILMAAMLLALAIATPAKELVREFRGSGDAYTAEFEARPPWIIDWRVTSDLSLSPTVEVSLVEAGTGVYVGSVLRTKQPGNGVRLFREERGRFQLRVSSTMANWTLRVETLTRAEADTYIPITRE